MAKLLDYNGLLYFWGKFKSRLLPSGGSTGQVLAKSSATNYDVTWVDQSGGGGGGDVATVAEIASLVVAAGWSVPSGTPLNNLDEVSY